MRRTSIIIIIIIIIIIHAAAPTIFLFASPIHVNNRRPSTWLEIFEKKQCHKYYVQLYFQSRSVIHMTS